jgi:predicted outer membrane repeat protein
MLSSWAFADTTWVSAGNVSGNWTAEHSPYVIQGDVHVPGEQALDIGAGVRVYFDGLYRLEVDSLGSFSAVGAEGDSVVFTTDTLIHPLRWCGILMHTPADTVRMSYCVIENMRRDSTRMQGLPRDTIANQAALQIENGIGLNLSHSRLRYNRGSAMGGALRLYGCDATITECVFTGNSGGYGGGINLGSKADIRNCLFEGNASGGGGGAIHVCFGNGESSIRDCVFRKNWAVTLAPDGGGAILHHTGILHVTGCAFLGDSVDVGADGGAINSGAVAADNPLALTVGDCLFADNRAGSRGGAIVMANGSMTNCTVVRSYTFGGAAVSWHLERQAEDTVSVVNTIVANSRRGSGIALFGTHAQLRNSLIFGNADGGAVIMSDTLMGRVIQTNTNGDSCDVYQNIFLDPLFADTAAGDYHLTANSPCIDAGDPASPRDPDGTVADIGAYYFPQPNAAHRDVILYPSAFSLSSYPNPFNAATRIAFDLPRECRVALQVYDISGRLVRVLVDGQLKAGQHEARFDGEGLASGVYFVRLQAGELTRMQKIVLMK